MTRSHEPRWLSRLVVDAIQQDMISTHGGLPGVRDENMLESALARARQVFSYGTSVDLAALGAACAYAIASDHPYHDGNKRTAFMAMAVFVELNGFELDAAEAEVVDVMLGLAAGGLDETALAEWLREHLTAVPEGPSL